MRNSYLISPLHVGYLYFIRPSPETSMQVCFISISRPVPIPSQYPSFVSQLIFSRSLLVFLSFSFQILSSSLQPLIHCSSLDMVFGKKMLSNLQIHRVWKVSILFEMALVIFQDSAPYRRTPKHITLKDRGNKS